MSVLSITLWILMIGFWMGYGYRAWGERRAARHALPDWTARLGRSIAEQVEQVDRGHKFAGDDIAVISQGFYKRGERRFLVEVTRSSVDA